MQDQKHTISLTPIPQLFSDAWQLLKETFLPLVYLTLLSIGVMFAIAFIFAATAVLLGFGSWLAFPSTNITDLFNNPFIIFGIAVIILIAIFILVFTALLFQIATIRKLLEPHKNPKTIELVKTSIPYVRPVFIVGLLSGLLTLGGYGLLIVPGIIISLLLSFSSYEAIAHQKKGAEALKRSFALISLNFWPIVGRLLLFSIITMIITVLIPKENEFGVLSTIVNIFLNWFGLCYAITLYKQVSTGNEKIEGKNLQPILITAIIGFILLAFFITGLIKMANTYPDFFNPKTNDKILPTIPNQQELKIPSNEEIEQMIEKDIDQDYSTSTGDKTI